MGSALGMEKPDGKPPSTFRRLWSEAKHEKGHLAAAGVCLMASSSANLMAPAIMAKWVFFLAALHTRTVTTRTLLGPVRTLLILVIVRFQRVLDARFLILRLFVFGMEAADITCVLIIEPHIRW